MELIGSLFLVLALAMLVAVFLSQPFLRRQKWETSEVNSKAEAQEHVRSSLMAEHDRILTALQELDFDNTLGKIPPEDYPVMRASLLKSGADVLRKLDAMEPAGHTRGDGLREIGLQETTASAEERIEAVVAERRADSANMPAPARAKVAAGGNGHAAGKGDALEDLIASRKRQREEKTGGFCPRCGRTVQKSDKFCARCGSDL
jgi:hypothetical protein